MGDPQILANAPESSPLLASVPTDTTTTLIHVPDAERQWWRSAVIYQVYPRSFADHNGDGIGDLPGITSKLSHLARLGVDALWISPFYPSPQNDAGYDVANYRDIDPVFGTLGEAEHLVTQAHRLGLKVIIDLVPNHSSDQHRWFIEALASPPGSRERLRYIFKDGQGVSGEEPPTDWRSVFGGSAWKRVNEADGSPGQWYLHLFDATQPDFNWDNPEVREEFERTLRFWLDRGVDGFRVDVAHGLIKDPQFPDWDRGGFLTPGPDEDPSPYWGRPEVHGIYERWNQILSEYDGDRVLVAEAWAGSSEGIADYVRPGRMHQAFNFRFLETPFESVALKAVITESLTSSDQVGAPTTWVLNNHDVVRSTSRFGYLDVSARPNGIGPEDPQPDMELGLRRARAAALLMLSLPGSAYLYQGEELGLPEHTTLAADDRQDPYFFNSDSGELGRDGCRIPIPWNAGNPALGFNSTGRRWLPQPPEYKALALDQQRGVTDSTYELYRSALRLRRGLRLGTGSLAWVEGFPGGPEEILGFVNRELVVVANTSDHSFVIPPEYSALLASQPLTSSGDGHLELPPDTTVWLEAVAGQGPSADSPLLR